MKTRLQIILFVSLTSVVLLSGCGSTSTKESSLPLVTTQATSAQPAASPNHVDLADQAYITVEAGSKLGPDGKKHDAFINGDIKLTQGQKVTLHFYNYDDGVHTYTSADLGLNVTIKGSEKKGEPAETVYTFTPDKTGTFSWLCADPCDGENGQWAMTHDGYMMGHITVLPADNRTRYVSLVVNAGYKLGSDGKLHDAFTPADLTIPSNVPVELTVYNFDDGAHSVTNADLGLNLQVKGSEKPGDPAVSTATFTASRAGTYKWICTIPCDGENGQWAMINAGYMTGTITAQ